MWHFIIFFSPYTLFFFYIDILDTAVLHNKLCPLLLLFNDPRLDTEADNQQTNSNTQRLTHFNLFLFNYT